ncbi:hypothetical protein EDD16DRAFT_81346 [Pisolithus croceorrhizus]|nr:hypothetical protein EDD16DRAFT_81346 [Pisolithus croceorrhizus]
MSSPFDFEIRLGMVFIVAATSTSALAVGGVLLYIAYSAVTIQRNASRRWSTETHIHYYFLNLMVSDFIQAVGGLLSIKWIIEDNVYSGPFCTAQGFFVHVGDIAVALSTAVRQLRNLSRQSTDSRQAIALHILQVLVLGWRPPPKSALLILAINWLSILILVAVPNVVQHNIYGPTGYWCWIDRSTVEQIGFDYMWMWMAAVLNIISYLLLVLVIKRVVLVDGNRLRWRRRRETIVAPYGMGTLAENVKATQMLFYPLVYIIVVLPISAARFSRFAGHNVPYAVTTFADILFTLSGLFDTILYALTRPRVMPRRSLYDPQSALLTRTTAGRTPHDGKSNTEFDRSSLYDIPELSQFPTSARNIVNCQV